MFNKPHKPARDKLDEVLKQQESLVDDAQSLHESFRRMRLNGSAVSDATLLRHEQQEQERKHDEQSNR